MITDHYAVIVGFVPEFDTVDADSTLRQIHECSTINLKSHNVGRTRYVAFHTISYLTLRYNLIHL